MGVNIVAAIIIGYLLGSFPTAYITGRVVLGEDIRKLGSGNVGGLNIYRQIGTIPAVVVVIVDIGKGAAAVAVAYWLLQVSVEFVLATALAAIIGHMWMVFLKFSGGKAIGTVVGVLSVLLPVYGYWPGLIIFFGVIVVPLVITHNVALSTGTALAALPLITWLGMDSVPFIIWSIVIGVIIALRYLPSARESWARTGTVKGFFFDRGQR